MYALDENGERIPVIDPATGVQKLGKRNEKIWKRVSVQVNPLVERDTLLAIRQGWADIANKYLAADNQISHLSLKDQGIDREPMVHEGVCSAGYSSSWWCV